jgi:hypothetical protein
MKRIALVAVAVMVGVFTSAAAASVGASSGAHPATTVHTSYTAEYNASAYYGGVKCTGTTITSKKHPFGRDVEICETTEGTLKNVVAGKHQTVFKNGEGGTVGEWESDSGDGKRTTNYFYSVNKKLTKFKLVAIYES